MSDLGELSAAEQLVVNRLDGGREIRIGDGQVPACGDCSRLIRAELLRLLILGFDPDFVQHKAGIWILGGLIIGKIDFSFCNLECTICPENCLLECAPDFTGASLAHLGFPGSQLPGIIANQISVRSRLNLNRALVLGETLLIRAKIDGDLDCQGTRFLAEASADTSWFDSVSADGIQVQGSIFMLGAMAVGTVRLLRAEVAGALEFDGAKLSADQSGRAFVGDALTANDIFFRNKFSAYGAVILNGVSIKGQLDCTNASFTSNSDWRTQSLVALGLHNATLGALHAHEAVTFDGALDLTNAMIGSINDSSQCWPSRGYLLLNGCRYGAITKGPVDAKSRLSWLARQDCMRWGADFWPQPYEQLAKVLREMGHGDDARTVLVEKERLQRAARRAREGNLFIASVLALRDGLLGILIGYGRRPLRAFAWLAGVWLFGAGVFWLGMQHGAMQPAQAGALASEGWKSCAVRADGDIGGASTCFLAGSDGRSYPPFQPLIYSAETLLPVINFEQRVFWRPEPVPVGGRGWWTRGDLWAHTAAGWALGLLAIAGFSGLVRSD